MAESSPLEHMHGTPGSSQHGIVNSPGAAPPIMHKYAAACLCRALLAMASKRLRAGLLVPRHMSEREKDAYARYRQREVKRKAQTEGQTAERKERASGVEKHGCSMRPPGPQGNPTPVNLYETHKKCHKSNMRPCDPHGRLAPLDAAPNKHRLEKLRYTILHGGFM